MIPSWDSVPFLMCYQMQAPHWSWSHILDSQWQLSLLPGLLSALYSLPPAHGSLPTALCPLPLAPCPLPPAPCPWTEWYGDLAPQCFLKPEFRSRIDMPLCDQENVFAMASWYALAICQVPDITFFFVFGLYLSNPLDSSSEPYMYATVPGPGHSGHTAPPPSRPGRRRPGRPTGSSDKGSSCVPRTNWSI